MAMDAGTPEPAEARPDWIRILPNLLSAVRLALGFAFPLVPASARWIVLAVALATEFLDGQLARWLRVESMTGRLLDPVADKVFVVCVLATLVAEGTLAFGQLVLVAARDLIVAVGALGVVVSRGRSALTRMPPSLLGKSATAAQFLFIAVAVVSQQVNILLFLATAALSLAAGIGYVLRFR
jgi:cardiolipin synthase